MTKNIKAEMIMIKKKKLVITASFRFHLNVRCVNFTRGSIMIAVIKAKMIGSDTGMMKIAMNIRKRHVIIYFTYSFLKSFNKIGYTPFFSFFPSIDNISIFEQIKTPEKLFSSVLCSPYYACSSNELKSFFRAANTCSHDFTK